MTAITSNTVTFTVETAPSSALGQAVAALSVNEWALFEDTWPGGTLDFWIPSNLNFSHVGAHDATRGKIHLIGAGYDDVSHVIYDVATNAWSSNVISLYQIHIWDHVALDEANGRLYFASQGGADHYSTTAADPTSYSNESAPWTSFVDTYGMEFWPGLGRIVISRGGTVRRCPVGGSWSQVLSGGPTLGYDSFLTYSPVNDVMYFGGGSGTGTVFYELSYNGSFSMTAKPASPSVDCVRQKVMCGDQTGDVVLIDFPNGEVHKYVEGSGWSEVSTSFPANLVESGALTAAIPLRGFDGREVFMCFRANSGTSPTAVYCYLYRYS
jgi:hypothetical protein